MVGRAAGLVISLGTAGFTAMLRQNERPKMEAQLRENLHTVFDEKWLELMHNPDTGVLAGVYQLSVQIEGSLANSGMPPARYEPPPPVAPLPDEQPIQLQPGDSDDEAPTRLW
jgi:hypothetical protein